MTSTPNELARRTQVALEAIQDSTGTEAGKFGADLFVSHHLEEIDAAYWLERLGTGKPGSRQILGLLIPIFDSDQREDGDFETLDFTLPGDVSNYLLSVQFDDSGNVIAIYMES
ncbi:DUF2004 domain-containing protein [Acaryochloris marina]|uniref:DUF2004 domain-containing protein n=1 Tax=Acaryochloris marina (strain MBIC 11017) TaxID=329726 RepID=B0C8G3_ACAM1|nr:DUF2004 domain-containing protein [Acaryochloris marina]ABW30118.1 hypothetical protein AM1_5156 [Acaryochloris marina MBIC11017]BDM78968.1 hypothetical protein AM10699_18360 [Acaryochloris marina MBIC10699]